MKKNHNFCNVDFANNKNSKRSRAKKFLRLLILIALAYFVIFFSVKGFNYLFQFAPSSKTSTSTGTIERTLEIPPLNNENNSEKPAQQEAAQLEVKPAIQEIIEETIETAALEQAWNEIVVKQGDSLSNIFKTIGISAAELHKIMSMGNATSSLKKILPGQKLRFLIDEDSGELLSMQYMMDHLNTLSIHRDDDIYHVKHHEYETDKEVKFARATIQSSLYGAGEKIGLDQRLLFELASVFGWDIDFALDIQNGDEFSILFEEEYLNGQRIRSGNILAAEFVNQGNVYRAIRYTNPDGETDYYTPEGVSLRKTFLKTPVKFTRISSKFSTGRKHPILHKIRAHKGVDYAAPRGTPVRAAGNGKIHFAGKKNGYGNVIEINHAQKNSTLYAHLDRIASNVKKGIAVKQGQVIGYVGSTGLATGPHLHYEFRVNGVHQDPLKVTKHDAEPIPKELKAEYAEYAENMLNTLREHQATAVAYNGK